jgi:hypothetical protein
VNNILDRPPAPSAETDYGCWTTDYVLRHCEGYAVAGPAGHLGFVSRVVETADSLELVVQVGENEARIPASAIEHIDAQAERIAVAPSAW